MSPEHAETYYKMSVPGDPVKITGSPRAGTWDNGWTVWFLPWNRWVRGSALHEAVQTGPDGSTFVGSSSPSATIATAPLAAPTSHNLGSVLNPPLRSGRGHANPGRV
jgi:hypothetical protein